MKRMQNTLQITRGKQNPFIGRSSRSAPYQIRKIEGCACAGNAGTISPQIWVSDPDMHHVRCVTHVPWYMPGSLTSGFLWSRWRENVPGFPGACATSNFKHLVRGPWEALPKNKKNMAPITGSGTVTKMLPNLHSTPNIKLITPETTITRRLETYSREV